MRKFLSLLLAVMMIASAAAVAVNATDVNAAADGAGKATVTVHGFNNENSDTKTYSVGETFTVYTALDLSRIQEKGMISSINAQQEYDSSILKLAENTAADESIDDGNEGKTIMPILSKGSGLANGSTPGIIKYNATVPSTTSPLQFTGKDSMLLVVRYTVLAPGSVDITTSIRSLNLTDFNLTPVVKKYEIINSDFDVYVSLSEPAPSTGSTVSGKITSFLSDTDDIAVALLMGDEHVASTTVQGKSATYSFDGIADGEYVLHIEKKNHVSRDYAVSVSGEDVTQDAKIHLIGDINGDGVVNARDTALANRFFKKVTTPDAYQLKCADVVRNDGRILAPDVARINAAAKKLNPFWE